MKTTKNLIIIFILTMTYLVGYGQEDEAPLSEQQQAAKLAKSTQNPLAAMYSLPFQNNTTFGMGGDNDQSLNVLNIQPVIPVSINENINLINRVIFPVISTPTSLDENSTGLGDSSYTAWFSQTKKTEIIWGIGPAFQLPTSSSRNFGSGEFGVGPSIVALKTINKWVAGVVLNNVWTFGDAKENKFLFQYFLNYNLPKAWYVVSAPILTANWNAPSGEQWTIPFGVGAGKVFKLGKLPLNFNAHVYYNVEAPVGYGDFQTRFQLQFLFPRG